MALSISKCRCYRNINFNEYDELWSITGGPFIGDVITCQLAHCDDSLVFPSFKPFFHESKHEQVIFVRTHLLSLLCMRACFFKNKKEKLGTHSTQWNFGLSGVIGHFMLCIKRILFMSPSRHRLMMKKLRIIIWIKIMFRVKT